MRDQLNKGEHLSTPLKTKKHSFFQGGETKRMKTRKIMASLLAFAMLLSLVAVPVGTADAASSSSVDRVVQVAKDKTFNATDAVYLRIDEKNAGEVGNNTFPAYLSLKNAKFAGEDAADFLATLGYAAGDAVKTGDRIKLILKDSNAANAGVLYDATTGARDTSKKAYWMIPLVVEVDGEGEVQVVIDGQDSPITSATHTFAVAASGGSVANIDSVTKFSGLSKGIKDIVIDETRVGSLKGAKELKLRLSSSAFTWNNVEPTVKWNGTPAGSASYAIDVDGEDTRTMTIKLPTTGIPEGSYRGSLVISGLELHAKNNAKFEEISVNISGNKFTTQDLVVAAYQDYGVVVEAGDKEIPEIYSGRWGGENKFKENNVKFDVDTPVKHVKDEENKLQTLVIEENSPGAWLTSRRTRVEFPSDVKIIGLEVEEAKNFEIPGQAAGYDHEAHVKNAIQGLTIGENYIEFAGDNFATESGKKAKLEITFYVSVAAGFEGDIVAEVSGKAVDETTEVVLGKAVKPVKAEANSVDLRIGVLAQPVGDIIITEVEAGAIDEGTIKVSLPKEYLVWGKKPTVEVVSGNIELDEKNIKINADDKNVLDIPVKSDSSKVSQIKISGGTVDVNRTVPEGVFKVTVGGNALVQNNSSNADHLKNGAHNVSNAASFEALNVITPAPGEERRTVKFNLDSKEYVVIEAGKEVTKTMDVAPYNENGRALLPIRFVAEALGVSEDNIVWNANIKEVTIFKGDRVAKVSIGSNTLTVNGTQVVMDTTAAIKDGRTVLPIRFVGQALGANIGWDDATRTITVQQ